MVSFFSLQRPNTSWRRILSGLLFALTLLSFGLSLLSCGTDSSDENPNEPDTDSENASTMEQDPLPFKDPYENAELIAQSGLGYTTILRVKSSGRLLFSPYVDEVVTPVNGGETSLSDYTFELTFSLLDSEGREFYTYPTQTLQPRLSAQATFLDFFLEDSDFCPTAGRSYNIHLGIRNSEGTGIYYGNYTNILTPYAFTTQRGYNPTEIPDTPTGESYYLCYGVLGEGGSLEGERTQLLAYGETSSPVTAVAAEGSVFLKWSDGVTTPTREGDTVSRNRALYAIFASNEIEDHGVPILNIQVENAEPITDTETWKSCTVSALNCDADQAFTNRGATVRGRGNGSWTHSAEKKPLKLKFDQKIHLLDVGGGAAKDWVLLPQAKEFSFLRNIMAFRMGQLLDGIDYASGYQIVEVYLNNRYMGIYLLCEQMEAQENRIHVNDSTTAKEIGFLVELDYYAEGSELFTVNGQKYSIKSNFNGRPQYVYIRSVIEAVDDAIYSGDQKAIEALVDIDSMVDMYLIHEYLKNTDTGFSSFYLYQDVGGKLFFGAPWDFDLSQGNDPRFRSGAWDGFDCGEGYDAGYDQDNEWFKALWKTNWFKELAARRWYEITDTVIPQMWKDGQRAASEARDAIDANYETWETLPYGMSYDDCLEELMSWLQNRKQWMDQNFKQYLS